MAHRILISGGLASGGVQTHTMALCNILRTAGCEVTLLGGNVAWNSSALSSVADLGVKLVVPHPSRMGKLLYPGAALLSLRRRFDVVLCMGTSSLHWLACCAARRHGFKVYNEIIPRPNQSLWPLIRCMDGLLGVAKFTCAELHRLFPEKPLRRLPHLYNATQIAVPKKRRPELNSRPMHFAYLGRIDAGKRPDRLVAEWEDICCAGSLGPSRLTIYGGGEPRLVSRLEELIRKRNLSGQVTYRGAYEPAQLDDILAEVDILLHPSQWEGLALVPLEAMQRGVPVVATEAYGCAELAENNPDVVITRGNDWGAFRQGIAEMAARLRAGLLDSGRLQQWVSARYDRSELGRQWRQALLQPRTFFRAAPGDDF